MCFEAALSTFSGLGKGRPLVGGGPLPWKENGKPETVPGGQSLPSPESWLAIWRNVMTGGGGSEDKLDVEWGFAP